MLNLDVSETATLNHQLWLIVHVQTFPHGVLGSLYCCYPYEHVILIQWASFNPLQHKQPTHFSNAHSEVASAHTFIVFVSAIYTKSYWIHSGIHTHGGSSFLILKSSFSRSKRALEFIMAKLQWTAKRFNVRGTEHRIQTLR